MKRCNWRTFTKYIVWAVPGLLSFSLTSQIFTVFWLAIVAARALENKKTITLLILVVLTGLVFFLTTMQLGELLPGAYIKRSDNFTSMILSGDFSVLSDGSLSDRYAGVFSGIRYAGALQIYGTEAPTGYRSTFGVLFQTIDLFSIVKVMLFVIFFWYLVGLHGFIWFSCVLLIPNQYLTLLITYISFYFLVRAKSHEKILQNNIYNYRPRPTSPA
ncbi:hypothetical protein N9J58_00075 [bacterium]|nr:hypothetical protein [bacterium]